MQIKRLLIIVALPLIALASSPLTGQEKPDIPESVRETPVVRAVRKVQDSVVSIKTTVTKRYAWFYEEYPGYGSGVIFDREGLIVTNYHVIMEVAKQRNPKIEIRLRNEKKVFHARVLTHDIDNDLAVLRITDGGSKVFRPITPGISKNLMVGETVIAVGNPFGQENTVTVGVLSAIDRKINIAGLREKPIMFTGLIQTDAAINPGNSGGALVDLTGKLIGINNAIRRDSEGIGYAIPIDKARTALDRLLDIDQGGNYWMGMTVEDVKGQTVVTSILKEGPAWRSGLRRGDQILQVGTRPVKSKKDYGLAFLASVKQKKSKFTIRRGGGKRTFNVVAGTGFDKFFYQHLGFEGRNTRVPMEKAKLVVNMVNLDFQSLTTVKVTRIYEAGPLAKAGVKAGDLLVAYTAKNRYGQSRDYHLNSLSTLAQTLYQKEIGGKYKFMVLRNDELFRGTLIIR